MSARAAILLLLLAPFGLTVLTPAGAAPPPEEIARWIKQLGDGDFTVREKASQELWKAGRAAEPALVEAVKSDDAEIVRRSRELLDRFRWGIYPDTPKPVVELIQRYQAAGAPEKQKVVTQLLELGGQGCAALLKIAHAEDNEEMRNGLFRQVALEAPRAIPAMLADGNFTLLEQLLDLSLTHDLDTAIHNYAAYYLLKGRLDERIAYFEARLGQKGAPSAGEVLAYLYRVKGDLPAARRHAEKAGKKELLESILWEQADWKELARRGAGAPGGMGSAVATLGFRAAYQRLAGDREQFEKTIAELRRHAETLTEEDNGEIWLCAKALFLNERPEDALALLRRGRDLANGFDILGAQLRYREAFDLATRARKSGRPVSPFLEVNQARTLYLLGEKDSALQLFGKAANEMKDDKDLAWIEGLIDAEVQFGLTNLAQAHCARALPLAEAVGMASSLLNKVFPQKGDVAEIWWGLLRPRFAGESAEAVLKRVGQLLAGKVALADLENWTRETEPKEAPKGDPRSPLRERWLWASAEAWLAAGKEERARGYLEQAAVGAGSSAALMRLGDFWSQRKRWAQAADCYGRAWEKDRKEPLPLYLKGWALTQDGQVKEGQRLTDLSHWLPLGDEATRYAFAEALSERGQASAVRRERELLLRVHSPGSLYAGDALRRQAYESLARKEYLRAADDHERAMLRVLHPFLSFIQTAAYIGVPEHVHRYRARGLLDAGKFDEARKEADAALALLPGNVELAVLLVPVLDKKGRTREADELFTRVLTPWQTVCKDYPESAWAHNSLAWAAACCRRHLDEGLEHARRAVELAPENAGYLDTLAEVYFQRGDRTKAVELSRKCATLDPKRAYFRKQVERHETGDRLAELPEEPDEG